MTGAGIRERRVALGLTQGQLAAALGVQPSYVSMVERGKRSGAGDVVDRLDEELARREQLARAGATGSEFEAAYRHLIRHYDLRMDRAEIHGAISWRDADRTTGDLVTTRRYLGCIPARQIEGQLFRDRIVGDVGTAGQLVIDESPPGLPIDCTSRSEGGWRVHTLNFPAGWGPDDGHASFSLRSAIPGAYTWDPVEYRRRLKADGLEPTDPAPTRDPAEFSWFARYVIRELQISIEMPVDYRPTWGEPGAWPDLRAYHAQPRNVIDNGVCAGYRFTPTPDGATLTVDRPLPGYTFSLHWTPPERTTPR